MERSALAPSVSSTPTDEDFVPSLHITDLDLHEVAEWLRAHDDADLGAGPRFNSSI